ncbi:poly [ADP-ribose] polymerase 2-like [Uloborus diversus]|uniref:poly [ADP-ribose] polymerase 2-like n=1 Tax=Uloborus diversus TaxID=327109 RepID=UPI0024091C50|nr:poly [ADP-ribose] polymerase 2-like [Uloborus diversus]
MQALKRKRNNKAENQPSSAPKKTCKVPVDPECPGRDSYHVYIEKDIVYHATLNQTNLQNNNNKFFIIQLLQHNTKKSFAVYFRWGRVGAKGQNNLVTKPGNNLEEAKVIFENKFFDKTKNEWMDIIDGGFAKVNGKYDFLRMDLNPQEEEITFKPVDSKLNEKVQALLELICNRKVMENIMLEMSYDSKKTPLGKLTIQQIHDGYAALRNVADAIQSKKKGSDLVNACNNFYTKIPHNFGMRTPPLLLKMEDVTEKIQMLEALESIRVALELMDEKIVEPMNPLDKYYKSLHCTLDVIGHSDDEFKVLENILECTHGPTHGYKLKLLDAFKCYKESEHRNFKDFGNTMLLWHGSRLSNWLGILKKGLLIAPPEAPVTGYMFGKGIYFADVCTKSANYCFFSKKKDEGLLLLSEVSVGRSLQLMRSQEMPKELPRSYNSVQGVGKYQPSVLEKTILSSEAEAVFGPLVESESASNCELNYNEYVVYDERQVKLKYLLRVTPEEL